MRVPRKKRNRNGDVTNEEKANKLKTYGGEELEDGKGECKNCGQIFKYTNAYNWHLKMCTKRRQDFHDTRVLTPANKEEMKKIFNKVIAKSCPECDIIVEAKDFSIFIENMQKHNSEWKIFIKTQLNEFQPVESEIDKVIEGVKDLKVVNETPGKNDNKNLDSYTVKNSQPCSKCQFTANDLDQMSNHIKTYHEISQDPKIPEWLGKLMGRKGLNIKDHRLIRTGGGGKCGVNCISVHTTGSEASAAEFSQNINEYIVLK